MVNPWWTWFSKDQRRWGGEGDVQSRGPRRGDPGIVFIDALESRVLLSVSHPFSPLVAANHPPTASATATLPLNAFQNFPLSITYDQLITATSANDLDLDPLQFKITAVPSTSGNLQLTHNGSTIQVVPGKTFMVTGDTLIWTPSAKAAGNVNAFTVRVYDSKAFAANSTRVLVPTAALPVVSAATTAPEALEITAGTASHNGTITLTRAGGDLASPLNVTINVAGSAKQGINYELLAPDGITVIATKSATITFPAGQPSVGLTIKPLQDTTSDATLVSQISVVADPNATSPSYTLPGLIAAATATANILDSSPTISIAAVKPTITEGAQSANAFTITRTAPAGGDLSAPLTVDLTYSGTFNRTDGHFFAPSAITFLANQTSVTTEPVIVTLLDNGSAGGTTTLTATVATSSTYARAGTGAASVTVLDASPAVGITTLTATTTENNFSTPGQFIVTRTGSTATPLTVALAITSGTANGVLGTNFIMRSGGHLITNAVTIPAGKNKVTVNVFAKDNFINDSLRAVIAVAANGSLYTFASGSSSTATITINSINRVPFVSVAKIPKLCQINGSITLSYGDLVNLTGAGLDKHQAHGTLQLKPTATVGTLQVLKSGATASTAASTSTLLSPGDRLIWIAPANTKQSGNTLSFSIAAVDGTQTSATTSGFFVSIA